MPVNTKQLKRIEVLTEVSNSLQGLKFSGRLRAAAGRPMCAGRSNYLGVDRRLSDGGAVDVRLNFLP